MHASAYGSPSLKETCSEEKQIRTTLYDLIAAINDSVEIGEENLFDQITVTSNCIVSHEDLCFPAKSFLENIALPKNTPRLAAGE